MGGKGRVCAHGMHSRSRMTVDPCIPTMPDWSTSGFHRPGRHRLVAPSAKGAGRGRYMPFAVEVVANVVPR